MSARPIVLVELSPSGGLFQYAFELGTALAARGDGRHDRSIDHPDSLKFAQFQRRIDHRSVIRTKP